MPPLDDGLVPQVVAAAGCGLTIAHPVRGSLLYANRAFLALVGYPLEEVLGRDLGFLADTEPDPLAMPAVHEALAAGRPVCRTVRHVRRSGEPFLHHVRLEPVHGEGAIAYVLGIHADARALPEPARAVDDLARTLSHEVKNPLMMITGLLELALRSLADGDPEAARADLGDALAAAGRIAEVVERLQDLVEPGANPWRSPDGG